jgi:alpha-N-acetylglucosaminidase
MFVVETISPVVAADGTAHDVFEVETVDGKTVLRGNSGVAVASAYNWFLRNECHSNLSWNAGDHVVWPRSWPVVQKVRVVSPYQFRYCYNFCTYGYTSAWWNWPHWEKELDFLATQGINSALVVPGMEEVFIETLKIYGYSAADARQWLVMPSHMPWMLMGNMEAYGGPVSAAIVQRRLDLGRKIVARMRELGIEPVLPGYYGMVPPDFATRNPGVRIMPQGNWGTFKRPDILDPTDPKFADVAASFYSAIQNVYGNCNYFDADPFHEGGSTNGIDLGAAGASIFGAMQKANPNSTWVLQGWIDNPKPPLIADVPHNKLLVIDLFCESVERWRTQHGWDGSNWIWGSISNFGGNDDLGGRLEWLADGPSTALVDPAATGMRGIGALMEGSETNPALWEMFFGNAWRAERPNLSDWTTSYVDRRYGGDPASAGAAWKTLEATSYSDTGNHDFNSALCGRPSLDPQMVAREFTSTNPPYDPSALVPAWKSLLDAAPQCSSSDGYQYDLADVGRQVLVDYFTRMQAQLVVAYRAKDTAKTALLSSRMLSLIDDVDRLMGTRREFLLGVWLRDARSWGATPAEQDLCEENARALLTTWALPQCYPDYANRQWNGLIGGFYKHRWQIWLAALNKSLVANQPIDEGKVRSEIQNWEYSWVKSHDTYATKPSGDTIGISRSLYNKWSALAATEDPIVTKATLTTGAWDPTVTSISRESWAWDITDQIKSPGRYTVTLKYTQGQSALIIHSIELVQGGKILSNDVHEGWTGDDTRNNVYTVDLSQAKPGTPITLVATVQCASSVDSAGTITVSPVGAVN